ncbi:MAG TPA: DMT family transporter [Burkholderiales bacterium]|jgi:S-adenosylmethionine uptake transporter|nr:DMT family transporter [Burkholderiales bacterium]
MQSLWMLLAAFLLAVTGVAIKYAAAAGLSTGETVFYRTFIGVVVVSVMMAGLRVSPRSVHTRALLYRGLAGTFAMWLFMYSVVHLPLSTAITLNFTAPLWIALILALVFGERLSKTMTAALVLGFIGIVMLLKPIFVPEMRFDITIGLLSGVAGATALLNVRRLGALGEPDMRIFLWSSSVIALGAALWLTATGGWHMHGFDAVKWVVAMGALATAAQLCQTRAYSRGGTILTANLSYATVLFSALADLLLWGVRIPASGWLAIALIIASGIMATLRSRKGARREARAETAAPSIQPEPPLPES